MRPPPSHRAWHRSLRMPFAEHDCVKAIFESTDIHTDNDRSTRSSTHRRSSLKCWGNPSKSGIEVAGTERERSRSVPTARPSTWRAADKRNNPWVQRYSPPGERAGRGLLISCARATRGRGLPSLDARSWESTRPASLVLHVSRRRNYGGWRRSFFPPCLPLV